MAKKNKSKASHTLVDLDQPLVKNEAQEVITCTESEPCMPDAQEASACAELERCSTADEQREPVYAEWELEPATEAQDPLANTEQESAADEQNELVPEQKINDEEDAPLLPEQELVNQASPDSPADQQDDQQEPDKLLEPVTPQIKKKTSLQDLNGVSSSLSSLSALSSLYALSALCMPRCGCSFISLPSKININIHHYYHTDK